jgi:hypothetical protein
MSDDKYWPECLGDTWEWLGKAGETDQNYVPKPRPKRESPPLATPLTPGEVWRTAKLLMDRDPADAAIEALHRIKELVDTGDRMGAEAWVRVAHAVEDMKSMEPPLDETLQ